MPRISEEKRAQRREQILDAARTLFTENGFHETSMDDIIGAAGMSAGGVYRYFAGKNDIVAAIAEDVAQGLRSSLQGQLDEDPRPPLAQGMDHLLRSITRLADTSGRLALQVWGEAQRDPAVADLAAREIRQIRAAVTTLVQDAADAGLLPADVDPDSAGRVLFAFAPGYLVQQRLLGDGDLDADAATLDALIAGLVGQSSR